MIANAKQAVGVPECIVYGDEDKCRTWFPNYPEIRYISLDRAIIDVNATKLRKIILKGDEKAYRKYTAKGLHRYFPLLRRILLEVGAEGDSRGEDMQRYHASGNR